MRVLFTESSKAFGGQERRLLHEARLLRTAGFDPLIACPGDAALFDRAVAAGFDVRAVRMRNSLQPSAILSIVSLLRRKKVNLIYRHSGKDSWIAGICGRLTGVPLMRSRELLTPIRDASAYHLLPSRVLACSGAVRQQLLDAGVGMEKVFVQYPPVDTRRFAAANEADRRAVRAELQLDGRFPVLACVARFMAEKRQADVLRALPRITTDHPTALLLFVGSGPDLAPCRVMASELGMSGHVRFLGEREDVPAVLAATDIFVLPSAIEPFGMAVVEAMAAGVPVVTTHTGGLAEIVADNVNGLLVPVHSPPSLAAAVLRIARDAELRALLIREGRRRAEDFSEQRALQRLLEHVRAVAVRANQQQR